MREEKVPFLSLPPIQECFNSSYGTSFFSSFAEKIPGESTRALSEAAKENKIYLVGGRTPCAIVKPGGAASGPDYWLELWVCQRCVERLRSNSDS